MKPFLIITGMHRSGTSFLARAMNLAGMYLGNLDSMVSHEWRPMQDNLKGHWENARLQKLSQKILSDNKGKYDIPPKKVKVNKKFGLQLKKYTKELDNYSSLASGFKDPRILLYLDSYSKFMPKQCIIIGIFRSPLKVAESLATRNNFSYEKSLNLWKIYNQKLLENLEKYKGFLINFDWPKQKLFSELNLIFQKLGLHSDIDLSE